MVVQLKVNPTISLIQLPVIAIAVVAITVDILVPWWRSDRDLRFANRCSVWDTRTMRYEVEVIIPNPLDEKTRQFLNAVRSSANRVVRFRGDGRSTMVTVRVDGVMKDDAVRAAAREIASIFPRSEDEKYGEPRPA